MANIRSFPNNQDEYIGAEDVMRWHHGRKSGVFGANGNAAVAPVLDEMAVTVSDGIGWMSNENGNGIVWWVDDEARKGRKLQLAVDIADAVSPRIDRVVVSWPTKNYVALPDVMILKGEPASKPVAPALTNNSLERQISLAAIRIPAGATAIDASMITDERLDESVCGIVTDGVGVDTSVMQAQFETFWAKNVADFEDYMARQKAAWETFFASVNEDSELPIPAVTDAGKFLQVNEDGDGYVFGDPGTHCYGSLEQIGITRFPTSMDAIVDAMPVNSMLILDVNDCKERDPDDPDYHGIMLKDAVSGFGLDVSNGVCWIIRNVFGELSLFCSKLEGDGYGDAIGHTVYVGTYHPNHGIYWSKITDRAPNYEYGTSDLTAGVDALETGKLYFVYE